MLRTRLAALPVLAVLALTACSGGDDPAPQASASKDESAALVRAAASETTATGSSKFALTSTTAIGGQDVTFAGEGAYDYAKRTGQLMFAVPGSDGSASGGGTIEQRIIGPDLFLTLPQQAGVFYRLKVADVAGTSLGNSTDPTASLQALAGLTQVEQVGERELRGVRTTHYEGRYDVADAIEKATGVAKTILQSTLGASSVEQVPFDAFLDEQGRLVRFEQELELPATAQTGGQALTSRTVLELFDFGTAVTVAAPPAAKVRDGAPLLAALKAAVPQPGGSPSAAPSAPAAVRPSTAPSTAPSAAPSAAAPAPAASPAG